MRQDVSYVSDCSSDLTMFSGQTPKLSTQIYHTITSELNLNIFAQCTCILYFPKQNIPKMYVYNIGHQSV